MQQTVTSLAVCIVTHIRVILNYESFVCMCEEEKLNEKIFW